MSASLRLKPRTAKQQAHAKQFSARAVIVLTPKDTGLPYSSWWLSLPPQGFTACAVRESERMKLSKFGLNRGFIFGEDA